MDFRWNNWNAEHVDEHGVTIQEAEFVSKMPEKVFRVRKATANIVYGDRPRRESIFKRYSSSTRTGRSSSFTPAR
jgi:uncharacterized DUF497 family protein